MFVHVDTIPFFFSSYAGLKISPYPIAPGTIAIDREKRIPFFIRRVRDNRRPLQRRSATFFRFLEQILPANSSEYLVEEIRG